MNLKLLKLLSKNARLKDDELAVMTGADEKDVHKNIAERERRSASWYLIRNTAHVIRRNIKVGSLP